MFLLGNTDLQNKRLAGLASSASPILALFLVFCSSLSFASSRFDNLTITIDRTLITPAGVLSGQEVLSQSSTGVLSTQRFDLPSNVRISALDTSGELPLFVPNIVFASTGKTVTPRDIVRISADGSLDFEVQASVLGLEAPSRISAISRSSDGLLFSIDTTADLGGVLATPQDVLIFDGETIALYIEGELLGIPDNAVIQGVTFSTQGNVVLALSNSNVIDGRTFRRGDLIVFDMETGQSHLGAAATNVFGQCSTCNISSISGIFDDDVIFRSSFNSTWSE